jgi:hypothetical protein
MILVIEVSGPFQIKPGKINTSLMWRVWWLYFAIGFLKCDSLKEYGEKVGGWTHNESN